MNTYTVMLLYPDYVSDQFGHEHFTECVEAETVSEAVKKVRESACEANTHQGDCHINDPTDFAVTAVMLGKVEFVDTGDL